MKPFLLLGLLCSLAACDVFDPKACTLEARPSIAVFVRDSTTNTAVQSGDLMVVATTGSFSDTLRANLQPGQDWAWSLAHERAGRYAVEVFVTNYHPWVMSNVRVDAGECHVETRTLTALMRPVE